MSNLPENLKYTKEHEWIRIDGTRAVIGITDFAQSELGDIVFVELPEEGTEIKAGDTFGTVESVKTVSDLFAPVSGRVIEVNEGLADAPEHVNSDPYGNGWMIVVEFSGLEDAALLSVAQYQEQIAE